MRFNEQGRSMIEMLGVLAIVGVLSVGGIAGYSKAMNKFKTNKAIEQINMISTNIRTLYSSQKNYNGLNNATAVKTGVLPNEMYEDRSSTTITNAFGGGVEITVGGNRADTDEGAFIIAMDKVPEASCVSIVTTEWGSDAGGGLVAMTAGEGEISNLSTTLEASELTAGDSLWVVGDANHGLPVSVIDASNACAGSENYIAWKYL